MSRCDVCGENTAEITCEDCDGRKRLEERVTALEGYIKSESDRLSRAYDRIIDLESTARASNWASEMNDHIKRASINTTEDNRLPLLRIIMAGWRAIDRIHDLQLLLEKIQAVVTNPPDYSSISSWENATNEDLTTTNVNFAKDADLPPLLLTPPGAPGIGIVIPSAHCGPEKGHHEDCPASVFRIGPCSCTCGLFAVEIDDAGARWLIRKEKHE